MMPHGLMLPLVVSTLLIAGFSANEWTGGGVSEALGLGHHHLVDPGPHGCDAAAAVVSFHGAGADQPPPSTSNGTCHHHGGAGHG